jgi:hypothetical protein
VICRVPGLAFGISLGNGDELLNGVIDVLIVNAFIATGGDRDPPRSPLWPPLITFGAPLCSLVGRFGQRPPTTTQSHLPAALYKNGPDLFFARGVPSGYVEEFFPSLGLVIVELVHKGLAVCAGPEHRHDVDVTNLGEFMTFLGETPDVLPQGFLLLLLATLQILGIARPHIRALEVASKNRLEVLPIID